VLGGLLAIIAGGIKNDAAAASDTAQPAHGRTGESTTGPWEVDAQVLAVSVPVALPGGWRGAGAAEEKGLGIS
jgi:hypothetical protein